MTARENIPMPIASQAIAQILRAISPPTTLVHVGWGNGLGDLTQWTAWQVPQAFVIEAEESKLAACQAQALALAQAEGQPNPAWQTIHATLSAQSGEQTYHLASNPSESGLLPTASLQHAWPHLQTVATQTVVTCSLDEIWQNISSQLPMSKSAPSTWFIIDCLASADILAGGLTTLQAAQVVCARSLLANRAVLCDLMRAAGWVEAGWAESLHPAFGHAWFTRDTASELEIAVKPLSKQLDRQKLEIQTVQAWPKAEDISVLRLPNSGAVRAPQKKLDAATTLLLNPKTQVMATRATYKNSGWLPFGLFGKSKQLSQELRQTQFDLQKNQAELAQAHEHLADLQTLHEQTLAEQKRQTFQAAENISAEKLKAQVALEEQQQEGELLLQQLHQVQEELEQIFLNREDLKKQLETVEKAKADAQSKVSELDKKTKDLDVKVKDLDAAKAKTDAANAELSKAKAEADKKAADAQTKASAAEKKADELDKAKTESDKKAADAQTKASAAEMKATELDKAKAEADKKAAEAQTRASAAEKKATELDKAKAEADKKAAEAQTKASAAEKKATELAAQLQSASANLPQQTKALQEAQQENDLLLKQLHQVQEELESYFLKNKETDNKCSQLQERLDRVLTRLTTWADAEQINATEIVNENNHRCVRLDVQNLWVERDAPVPNLSFLLGGRDGVPYMEFRPADKDGMGGAARSLLPWPEEFKDEQGDRLLIAPGAPGAFGKAQAKVISGLSASQWHLVKGLLVLVGSQVNRLNLCEQSDRMNWVNITRDLAQQLDAVSTGVHFESAEVMAVTQPEAGTEVMRVAIRDLSSRNTRLPLCVFELGIKYKTLKSGPLPQMFFMDFRPWKGAVLPFVNFKPNSQDEQGEFLRISLARTGRYKNNTDAFDMLDASDRVLMKYIGAVFVRLAKEKALNCFGFALNDQIWVHELDEVGQLLRKSLAVDA